MASHRHQRHSVVTSDGAIHIIVNTGISGTALQLYTSTDNGKTWNLTFTFTGTVGGNSAINGPVSTDDVNLVTGTAAQVGVDMGPDVSTHQFLQVAYDVDPPAATAALMYTVLLYRPGVAQPWYQSTAAQSVTPSSGVLYQEPAIAVDASNNLWLTDLEVAPDNSSGQIVVYERPNGKLIWGNKTTIGTPGTTPIDHAPRPVFLPASAVPSSVGYIGMLYQNATCLYWVTINALSTGVTHVSTPIELSSYSNGTNNAMPVTCALPSEQSGDEDTGASIATDLTNGDQYLGFAVTAGRANNVYTMAYQQSTHTWIGGSTLTMGITHTGTPTYVKSVLATGGSSTSVDMFINDGASTVALFSSSAIPTATSYSLQYDLNPYMPSMGSYSYSNPRIEAPEYIDASISDIPVWEQYTYDASGDQSLVYWRNVSN